MPQIFRPHIENQVLSAPKILISRGDNSLFLDRVILEDRIKSAQGFTKSRVMCLRPRPPHHLLLYPAFRCSPLMIFSQRSFHRPSLSWSNPPSSRSAPCSLPLGLIRSQIHIKFLIWNSQSPTRIRTGEHSAGFQQHLGVIGEGSVAPPVSWRLLAAFRGTFVDGCRDRDIRLISFMYGTIVSKSCLVFTVVASSPGTSMRRWR